MIKLCESSISIIAKDGSRKVFEAEELQSKIIQSCISAGINDSWIAEDISLSIEYALSQSSESEEKVFTLSEVNMTVTTILEQIGYPNVAKNFNLQNRDEDLTFSTASSYISDIISRKLGLSGTELTLISEEVHSACKKISIEKAPISLIFEFAKYYKSKLIEIDNVPVNSENETHSGFQPPKCILKTHLEENAKAYIDNNILEVFGVSKLFPVIKVEMKILELIKNNGLKAPLTELCVVPSFHNLSEALNNIIYTSQSLYDSECNETKKALPVYLNVRDISTFSEKYLDLPWPASSQICMDLLASLEEMLDFPVFKFTLK